MAVNATAGLAIGSSWTLLAGKPVVAIGAAALQVVILVGMIGVDSAPLLFGETIRLKVVPVDPRDLFRGDYVVLGYDFSRPPPSLQSDARGGWYDFGEDQCDVYVSLRPSADGTYFQTDTVSRDRPSGQRFLQGQLSHWGRAEFGIEAWYVQEGEGRRLEEAIRGGRNVYADVAVWRGTARLKNVIVD